MRENGKPSWTSSVIFFIFAIIGAGGFQDDIAGWARMLNKIDQEAARWIFLIIGLLGLLIINRQNLTPYFKKHPLTASIYAAGIVLILGVTYWVTKDSGCNLNNELNRITWAIEEKDSQHFKEELKRLYPRLKECDLETPVIESDDILRIYHLHFLKALRRQIRYNEFDLEQWNKDVQREDAVRIIR